MDVWALRHRIYEHFAATGSAPPAAAIAAWAGDDDTARMMLADMHDRHLVVLDDAGEIRMALPFSGVETPHRVVAGERSWFANCAWDALAIPIAVGVDAVIDASWVDDGRPVELAVVDGALSSTEGYVHFAVPARRWWDDIVET